MQYRFNQVEHHGGLLLGLHLHWLYEGCHWEADSGMKTRPAGIGRANADWMGSLSPKLSAMPLKHLAVPGRSSSLTPGTLTLIDISQEGPWYNATSDQRGPVSSRLSWFLHLLGGRARSRGTRSEAVCQVPGHDVQCLCQESHGEVVHDSGNPVKFVQALQNCFFQIGLLEIIPVFFF